jgi:hypothetical protein
MKKICTDGRSRNFIQLTWLVLGQLDLAIFSGRQVSLLALVAPQQATLVKPVVAIAQPAPAAIPVRVAYRGTVIFEALRCVERLVAATSTRLVATNNLCVA